VEVGNYQTPSEGVVLVNDPDADTGVLELEVEMLSETVAHWTSL
jgi:hypothetical protein